MEVTVVAYDDCDVVVFANEKDALQYVINTGIEEGGICSIYTVTVHEGTPN